MSTWRKVCHCLFVAAAVGLFVLPAQADADGAWPTDVGSHALPHGAVALQALDSSDNGPEFPSCRQYVNTRHVPTANTRFVMKFRFLTLPTETEKAAYCGVQMGDNSKGQFTFGPNATKGKFVSFIASAQGSGSAVEIAENDLAVHTIDLKSGEQKFDGEPYGNATIADGSFTLPIYLFAACNGWRTTVGGVPDLSQKMLLFGCKIYEGDELVHDFVPCHYQGLDQLFDTVSGDFYGNDGTGSFHPLAKWKEGDFETEFVDTFGEDGAYLDTGFKPTPSTKVVFDFQMLSAAAKQYCGVQPKGSEKAQMVFGLRDSGGVVRYDSLLTDDQIAASWVSSGVAVDYARHRWTIESGSQTIESYPFGNPVQYGTQAITKNIDNNLYLLALFDGWNGFPTRNYANWQMTARFFGAQIYEAGKLVRDYRPRVRNGVACIREELSGADAYPYRLSYKPKRKAWAKYIDVSANSRCDTGVKISPTIRMELDFQLLKIMTRVQGCGALGYGNGNGNFSFYVSADGWFCATLAAIADQTPTVKLAAADLNRHVVEIGPGAQKIDGVVKGEQSLPAGAGANCPINLFARCRDSSGSSPVTVSDLMVMRLYGCRIWDGDTLIRNFRPIIGSFGESCLYDEVGKEAYTVSGSPYAERANAGLAIILR